MHGRALAHRGPDGEGTWMDGVGKSGWLTTPFDHRSEFCRAQPMKGRDGTIITLNGEIYSYRIAGVIK